MDNIHLEVCGQVQGVGFRWFVAKKARELKLSGLVRTRADGCVEIAASGDPLSLQMLEAAASAGPPGAKVDRVQKLAGAKTESLRSPFEIVR
jgi:acylphosphatase